ncbi:MAG: hypothetical protein ACFFEF_18345 [Candidatus Thorarchaeota archaeon]
MATAEEKKSKPFLKLRVYGVSASAVRSEIDAITGVGSGKKSIYTEETGRVTSTSEVYSSGACPDCYAGSSGGEGELYCLLIIAVLLSIYAIVWAIVMIIFSVVTIGGFVKRRYRTLIILERENREFLGKLSIQLGRRGGVLEYPLGDELYDGWIEETFGLFMRMKYLRQISVLLGAVWGAIEVGFKGYQYLIDASFSYDLWPFRFIMIAIFAPLIFYSPILEWSFRSAFSGGEEFIDRLLNQDPSLSPNNPMTFATEPRVTENISTASIRNLAKTIDKTSVSSDYDS